MRADFKVVIDACVLANYGVCDLMLRLAESPRLFLPIWSDEILAETNRTHLDKLDWPKDITASFQEEIRKAFPHASVNDYGHLIDKLENDEKDRHVLAAAIAASPSKLPSATCFSRSYHVRGLFTLSPSSLMNTGIMDAPKSARKRASS